MTQSSTVVVHTWLLAQLTQFSNVQWSSLISKSGFARENLLISELANRAILILEQLLIGEHYCTILQNNLIIASSC